MGECAFHPGVDTNVRCANCDRYICPKDMVETPVGIKCRECASPPRSTRPRGKPVQYLGALGAALGVGIVGGLLLGEALRAIPFVSMLSLWIAIGYGALIGEATRRGARGNRGPLFAAIAAAGGFVGALLGGLGLLGLLFTTGAAIAYVLAWRW